MGQHFLDSHRSAGVNIFYMSPPLKKIASKFNKIISEYVNFGYRSTNSLNKRIICQFYPIVSILAHKNVTLPCCSASSRRHLESVIFATWSSWRSGSTTHTWGSTTRASCATSATRRSQVSHIIILGNSHMRKHDESFTCDLCHKKITGQPYYYISQLTHEEARRELLLRPLPQEDHRSAILPY